MLNAEAQDLRKVLLKKPCSRKLTWWLRKVQLRGKKTLEQKEVIQQRGLPVKPWELR